MRCCGPRIRATASSSTAESGPPDTASTSRLRRASNRPIDVSTARTDPSGILEKLLCVGIHCPTSVGRYVIAWIQTTCGGVKVGDAWTARHPVGWIGSRSFLHGTDLGEPPARTHAHTVVPSSVDVGAGRDGEAKGQVVRESGMGNRESGGPNQGAARFPIPVFIPSVVDSRFPIPDSRESTCSSSC